MSFELNVEELVIIAQAEKEEARNLRTKKKYEQKAQRVTAYRVFADTGEV